MAKTQIVFIIILLNIASMVDGAKHAKGVALVNGVAEFRCTLEKFESLPKEKMDIYWQRGTQVLSYMSQHNGSPHVSPRYSNRTALQMNGVLKLYNVNFEDKGDYTCYLILRVESRREKVDECTYHLDVHANYSEPEITSEPSVHVVDNGTSLHFKCSSGHGYPSPQKMIWEVSSGNRTKKFNKPTEIKNISETFNASSELSLMVEEDVNITCVLEAHHNVTSRVLQIVVRREILPDTPDRNVIIIILGISFIVCFTAITIPLAVRRKKKQSRDSGNGGNRDHQMEPVAAAPPEQRNLMSTECETATS
ncbi:T-lymphocyte activation antigen CD86-like [Lithobates pipiens]